VFLGLRFGETGLESPICSAGNPGALCRIPVSKHDGLLMQPPSAQGRAERAEERELVISQGFPMVVMAGQQTSPSAGSLTRFFRGRYNRQPLVEQRTGPVQAVSGLEEFALRVGG
jgi:hypothetical protein